MVYDSRESIHPGYTISPPRHGFVKKDHFVTKHYMYYTFKTLRFEYLQTEENALNTFLKCDTRGQNIPTIHISGVVNCVLCTHLVNRIIFGNE